MNNFNDRIRKMEGRNNFYMMGAQVALKYAIFEHEVDKLMAIYSKYRELDVLKVLKDIDNDISYTELKEDFEYLDKFNDYPDKWDACNYLRVLQVQ